MPYQSHSEVEGSGGIRVSLPHPSLIPPRTDPKGGGSFWGWELGPVHLSSAFDETDQVIFSDPGILFILVPVPVGAESSQQGDG